MIDLHQTEYCLIQFKAELKSSHTRIPQVPLLILHNERCMKNLIYIVGLQQENTMNVVK